MKEERVQAISARVAARLFRCSTETFYDFTMDSGVYIREVPDRPRPIPYMGYRDQDPSYTEDSARYQHDMKVRRREIPFSKIFYRLEDFTAMYRAVFEEDPKLPKPRVKKADRVNLTIEQLIASGKLSEQWVNRPSASEWLALRCFVFDRDNHTCQYCQTQNNELHCDHIIPISRGGTNHPDNLVTACADCNRQKQARTPEEWLSQIQCDRV